MNMSELILAVGDENIQFQNLLDSLHSSSETRHGTKLTFYTTGVSTGELMDPGKTKNVGLVLWLPRDKVEAAIAAEAAFLSSASPVKK